MTLYDRLRIFTAVIGWYALNLHFLRKNAPPTEDMGEKCALSVLAVLLSFSTSLLAFLAYSVLYWVATGSLP